MVGLMKATDHSDPILVSRQPLPTVDPEHWGKDHYATLAYIETRCVDRDGSLMGDQMRTNPRRHREFVGETAMRVGVNWGGYTTRLVDSAPDELQESVDQLGHDDWDCVDDLIRTRLVRIVTLHRGEVGRPFGDGRVRVELTERGQRLAAALRVHKQRGGNFGDFDTPGWLA